MKKIAIINYGMGNIGSVAHALDILGSPYVVSDCIDELDQASALILPGVGAFKAAMENLKQLGLTDYLTERVVHEGKPFLGICLGMQLIAEDSTEQGFSKGFGWIKGHVVDLHPAGGLNVPHVGWNTVSYASDSLLYRRIAQETHFYFDHSFYLQCDKRWVCGSVDYGGRVPASIRKENIWAVQFHPEKSQRNGLKMLRNFLNFVDVSGNKENA